MSRIRPLSKSLKASLARATETYQGQLDQPAVRYLEGRGLSSPAIRTLRLGVVRSPLPGHESYVGRLAVPYIGPRGNVADVRFKCIEDHSCKEVGCAKILGLPGVETRVYNTRSLSAPTDYIFLAEGEPDVWTYEECGWPAVGIPGAHSWKRHHARMLAGFSKVVLLAHGDDAGKQFADKVARALPTTCHVKVAPAGKDANAIFLESGKEGLKAFFQEEDE